MLAFAAREQRLREASESEQEPHRLGAGRRVQFAQRDGMQTVIVVSPREGIAALAIVIQPRGSRHEDGELQSLGVIDPFDEAAPARVLMDLI